MTDEENKGPRLSEEARNGFLKLIGHYNAYGDKLQRQHSLSEISKALSVVARAAKAFTLSEADDWFDKVTINRNMKELEKYEKDFVKSSQEAQVLEDRMMALYEDMGSVLNRYFEIKSLQEAVSNTGTATANSVKKGSRAGERAKHLRKQGKKIANKKARKLEEAIPASTMYGVVNKESKKWVFKGSASAARKKQKELGTDTHFLSQSPTANVGDVWGKKR